MSVTWLARMVWIVPQHALGTACRLGKPEIVTYPIEEHQDRFPAIDMAGLMCSRLTDTRCFHPGLSVVLSAQLQGHDKRSCHTDISADPVGWPRRTDAFFQSINAEG